jgi:nucleotide-binding universal stress UspA family protein
MGALMKTLLVPVDFSDASETVVRTATDLAAALGAKVWLLHVADPEPDFVGYSVGPQEVRDSIADALHTEREDLAALADRVRAGGVDVEHMTVQGPTIESIVRKASDLGADLIVMGSHGRGAVLRAVLGSVSEGVLRHAGRPVLIVPTPAS